VLKLGIDGGDKLPVVRSIQAGGARGQPTHDEKVWLEIHMFAFGHCPSATHSAGARAVACANKPL
jgi:hypothetical protein